MMQVITSMTPRGRFGQPEMNLQEGKELVFQRLNSEVAQRFRALTLPVYHHLLDLEPQACAPAEGDRRLVCPIAIGATRNRSPIGLALGTLPLHEGDRPRLISLYVTPRERRSGVASSLLRGLEDTFRERGFNRLAAVYGSEVPWVQSFEALLHKHDWNPPRPYEILLRFTLEQAMASDWYRRFQPQIPGRYSWTPTDSDSEWHLTLSPWRKIRVRDLETLYTSHLEKSWIPEDQLPWLVERRDIEPHSSLGIRLGTEVVGWVLNHRIDERSLRLSRVFIRKDLARQDLLSPALVESLRRARKAGFTRCQMASCWQDHELALFVKRFLTPWSDEVGESREAVKSLTAMPQAIAF